MKTGTVARVGVDHALRCSHNREKELTSRLSWVRRTATPASTLPTVKETNMVVIGGGESPKIRGIW